MQAPDRRVTGEGVRLSGTGRLTAPDDICERLLPERLREFRKAYPSILLELIVADRFLNLSRRDADVALRLSRNPPDTLVRQRIASVAVALYRSRGAFTDGDPLTEAPFHSSDDALAHTDPVRSTETEAAGRNVMRANSNAGTMRYVPALELAHFLVLPPKPIPSWFASPNHCAKWRTSSDC